MRKVKNTTPAKPMRFNRKMVFTMASIIGREATIALFERGALLNIWRNTSPSNWWVATKEAEHNYIWHSDSECSSKRVPNIRCFSLVNEEGIVYYGSRWSMFSSYKKGTPSHSKYTVNKKLQAVWNRMPSELKEQIGTKIKQ